MKKKICFITGARSDYGLLKPLMAAVKAKHSFLLQLIVTGSHLSPAFGMTRREILADGFSIDVSVPILSGGGVFFVTRAMAKCLEGVGNALYRLKPDILVCMGDRYEILCAVSAAMIQRVPVAHLSGGELTEGAMDDAIRHAITKMSHLHFTATSEYRRRVIQMGELPERVFNVGEVGLEGIHFIDFLPRDELEKELDIRFRKRNYLVTFHPETLMPDYGHEALSCLFRALDKQKDSLIVFTKCNADSCGMAFNRSIRQYADARKGRVFLFDSLGRRLYLSLIRHVDAVIGNSSSGIIEAPSLCTPTVNIGFRQEGRVKASSVIDCPGTISAIDGAIRKAVSRSFRNRIKTVINPYEGKGVRGVVSVLASCSCDALLRKKFFDQRRPLCT